MFHVSVMLTMWRLVIRILLATLMLNNPSLSCYDCFIEVEDSLQLCWGHVVTQYNIRNVDSCFLMLNRIFNNNESVIKAGGVGKGYDTQLKIILESQILPLMKEFDGKLNKDTVYETRLQAAAVNFIAAASKLPRVSGCVPPCGFQGVGAVYNCVTCQYDSCEFPLDCPVQHINVVEYKRAQMWCNVKFPLPADTATAWRYAAEVNTQQVDQFKEVTVGDDRLYSIPSAGPQHQGTYQCEIYTEQRSVVRLYFYLTVTSQSTVGHTELQDTFDAALLPGGQIYPASGGDPSSIIVLPLALLCTCLVAMLLLLFLSIWTIYWLCKQKNTGDEAQAERGDPVREVPLAE